MEGGKLNSDFSAEGIVKLQERMRERVRKLGPDFDDENLVEYVMVLLKNGRTKSETIKELHVFLENQSTPFVAWLWDHLSSNMHLYSNHPIKNTENKDRSKRASRSSQKREFQKELIPKEKKTPSVNMSRRLLQFAVKDAVKTEYSSPKTEYSSPKREYSSSMRIRSVILASPKEEDSRTHKSARSSRSSVFDRLTRVTSPLTSSSRMTSSSRVTSSNIDQEQVLDFVNRYEESSKYQEPKYKDFDNNNNNNCYYNINNNIIITDNNSMNKINQNVEIIEQSESESENDMEIIMPDSSYSDSISDRGINVKSPPEKVETVSINRECSSGSNGSDVIGEIEGPLEKKQKVIEQEPQKTTNVPYTNRMDDMNSRSVLITNVNFGATKDALSRHFNKFGAVLKVVIIYDPSTGQPTGSACVEFLQKESAELALSVNNTSFMSRILKVVKKNSAEAAEVISGTNNRFCSFGYGSYARGVAYFGGRPPIRRNFHWKRDTSSSAQPTNTNATI